MPTLPRILLVDDNYASNFLHTKLLPHPDPTAQVRTALNGQEALEVLRTHYQPPTPRCPTLVLLDINMPIINGFAFLEAYQQLALAQRQDLTILLLTTSISPRDLARLQHLPIAGLLPYPLSEEKIAQVLADHFLPSPAAQ